MNAPTALVPSVLLGGPHCGTFVRLMHAAHEAEVHYAPTREIFLYRAIGEKDRSGKPIFRFTGHARGTPPPPLKTAS